ncbi:MOXD1 homolog 1 [Anabrus simplex]|uniref:MOXD1 homolog 1 n=1 Tax=Anabrus simplex TaxID=316456 RepID=UPI0035A2CC7D
MGPSGVLFLVGALTLVAVVYNHHTKQSRHVGADNEKSLDLLDQYVLHVDRGKGDLKSVGRVRRHVDQPELMHSVYLDKEQRIKMSWTPVGDEIEFYVEAATRGYVGIGFSPGAGMIDADMVVGWVDDNTGKAHLVDCHGSDKNAAPLIDVDQNYRLQYGLQNDTHTTLRFRRVLDTCDSKDMTLGSDTVRVIWALHSSDPVDPGNLEGLAYHGREARGVRSLHLISPPRPVRPRNPHVKHWDVALHNFVVPDNMDTVYWCKIFKVPPLSDKHHMIGYEPVLQEGHERYVHHMLLYECAIPPHKTAQFDRYVAQEGESCYAPNMPQDWDQCLTPVVAWAVGSQGEFLPEHVGLPLGEWPRTTYFMLEIHYDNPTFQSVKDNSGLRVHYTKNLRKYDGGILVSGITVTPLHIIPPQQPEYKTAGYCSSQCTSRTLPPDGIKLVSVLLHSHLAGKKLRLRHIRNGQELQRVAEDNHYDFNYQQTRVLGNEVSVLPGDELVTECVYQTPNRTEPTFGGYSTKQEMCLAFILYYPRAPLAACYSMTPVKYFFQTFGVKEFYDLDMDTVERMFLKLDQPDNILGRLSSTTTTTMRVPSFADIGPDRAMDEEVNRRAIQELKKMKPFTESGGGGGGGGGLFGDLVISEPREFRNKSFTSHLIELPWAEQLLTQRIEETLYGGQHMVFCRLPDDQLAIPAEVFNFPNFTELLPPVENFTNCQTTKTRESFSSGCSVCRAQHLFLLVLAVLVADLRH